MRIIFIALVSLLSFVGCGGGGGGGGSSAGIDTSAPSKILSWAPPVYFTDSSTLNPAIDLDVFEIYVKPDGQFSTGDSATAAVSAFDPGTGSVNATFNLAGLRPYLSDGVTYYVSVRAVAKNGMKSDFSQPAAFSF